MIMSIFEASLTISCYSALYEKLTSHHRQSIQTQIIDNCHRTEDKNAGKI